MNRKAFTLIELIVTITILALILAISISSLNFYKNQLVKAELSKLEMTINYLNSLANLKNKEFILKLDTNNNSYYFEKERADLNKNVKFGCKVESKSTFPNDIIKFEPNGNISAGTIYLSDLSEKFVYALTIAVAKKQIIRKYKYNGKWQLI
ncbi:hypothetical protein A3F66_04960 [candidate division TM6 bacterium RIFCSPHIGHO2_12_FULL_32_22]|nr:MAG: hypothetical protein A3F66_04960 [candidate division TM6 bacterium RIFCSPHIGHO2_12_FULL_32_22]